MSTKKQGGFEGLTNVWESNDSLIGWALLEGGVFLYLHFGSFFCSNWGGGGSILYTLSRCFGVSFQCSSISFYLSKRKKKGRAMIQFLS